MILTKLDGDSRGGAALSVKSVTGVPIKFIGTGETLDDLDEFHPERMASRILGMGDLATLIESAQSKIDESGSSASRNVSKKAFSPSMISENRCRKSHGSVRSGRF